MNDTPENIRDLPIDSVLRYVDEKTQNVPSSRVRLNYVKMFYDILGFELTPDIALAAVSEPQAELVLSTAGGGKTTWSQIKAIEQKAIRRSKTGNGKKIKGSQILCLVYNNHNVSDMREKHTQLVHKIRSAGVKGLELDDQINACTMHSFCEFFRRQFVAKLGLVGFHLADEFDSVQMMERAIRVTYKKMNLNYTDDVSAKKIHDLYTLTKETLSVVEELHQTDVYKDLDLDDDFLNEVFVQFDGVKERSFKYEFIDMLYRIYELLSKDEKALKTVQQYYEYVIADEVQDFTPLMWGILRLFVSDGTPLTCIGDEDQNLYLFRGADIRDMLRFKEMFPGGKIYSLTENRRCRETILNEARRVISENTLRFGKQIVGQKKGGTITCTPYNSMESQVIKIVQDITALPVSEQEKSVICYRNVECSMLISEILAEQEIPINCVKAFRPYEHELYTHVLQVMNALEMPCDRAVYKNLWKVLPCKKTEFFESIGYNPKTNKFNKPDTKQHFATINYGKLMSYRGFADGIKILRDLSDIIETKTLDNIFPYVFDMLKLYFWNYKRSISENSELDTIFEERVVSKFNVHKRYAEVYRDIQNVKSVCANNVMSRSGITLSTFHSLKGLEFNHVFVMSLDNEIFPNFPLIEYKGYTKDMELALKEAETRLWYVVVTRAIETLHMYYNEINPSKYVADYLGLNQDAPAAASIQYTYSVDAMEDDFAVEDNSDDFIVEDSVEDDFVIEESGIEDDFVIEELSIEDDSAVEESNIPASPVKAKSFTDVQEDKTLLSATDLKSGRVISTGNTQYINSLFASLKAN